MATWEIGELPPGWTRGAPLHVINAYYREGSMISLQHVFTRFVEVSLGPAPLDVSLRFHYAERWRVLNWLRWYFDVLNSEDGRAEFNWLRPQIQ